MNQRATLADVARLAGVSLATASRAINGSANRVVGAELRDKVLAAAAELHYMPDSNAQAMARGETTSLGLVVHNIADPYFSSIAAGVTAAASAAGLAVTLAATMFDPDKEVALVELLQRQRARAIILAGGRLTGDAGNAALRSVLDQYRATGGRVAVIGQPTLEVDTIVVANGPGAAALARALHGRGYRRFAVLAGPQEYLTARDRRDGFLAGLRTCGVTVDPEAVVACAFTRDGGFQGMRQLLENRLDYRVVFAVNDVMAVGAMAAAREAGLSVPRDVAIAGFDDISTLRDISPALSSVHIPLEAMGASATHLVLEPAAGPARLVTVECTVVLRESTPTVADAAGRPARPLRLGDTPAVDPARLVR